MSRLLDLRLIPLFNLYLLLIMIVGVALRWNQYRSVLALVTNFRSRWPKLLGLLKEHGRLILLTWGTVLPLLVTLLLLLGQMYASHRLWPEAGTLDVRRLWEAWPALPFLVLTAAGMIWYDVRGALEVSNFDRAELEKYFDQAEYWLRSWAAPAVRFFTLGYINPRMMVAAEVRSALESASAVMSESLWWVSRQAMLRIACGLSLWGTYALEPWLRRLVGAE
jgi:hypothetical protein